MTAATAGAALLGVGAAPWLHVAASTVLSQALVPVSGAAAVPAVPAAGLVVLAAALALLLAGRPARVVAALAVAVAGTVAAAATISFVLDPGPAARSATASATGVRPEAVLPSLAPWPYLGLAVALATAAAGIVLLLTARSAPVAATRHDRPATAGPRPARSVDDWDALSRGEDPS